MALGWTVLYSKDRKSRTKLRALEDEYDEEEICDNCGNSRYGHAPDERQTCPNY